MLSAYGLQYILIFCLTIARYLIVLRMVYIMFLLGMLLFSGDLFFNDREEVRVVFKCNYYQGLVCEYSICQKNSSILKYFNIETIVMSGLVRPGLFSLMGCRIENIECAGRDIEVSRIYKDVNLSNLVTEDVLNQYFFNKIFNFTDLRLPASRNAFRGRVYKKWLKL